jgi:quinol monooxygenase YgiN
MGIAVFAKLTAKPGQRQALISALQPMVQVVLDEEPGTEVYCLHASSDDPDAVWIYEVFTDQAALTAHAENEQKHADAGAKVGALMGKPIELHWAEPLTAKGFVNA